VERRWLVEREINALTIIALVISLQKCMVAPSHTDHKGSPSHEAHMVKEEKVDNNNLKEPLLLMMVTNLDLRNNES